MQVAFARRLDGADIAEQARHVFGHGVDLALLVVHPELIDDQREDRRRRQDDGDPHEFLRQRQVGADDMGNEDQAQERQQRRPDGPPLVVPRDWAARVLYNCVVFGQRMTLMPRTEEPSATENPAEKAE